MTISEEKICECITLVSCFFSPRHFVEVNKSVCADKDVCIVVRGRSVVSRLQT